MDLAKIKRWNSYLLAILLVFSMASSFAATQSAKAEQFDNKRAISLMTKYRAYLKRTKLTIKQLDYRVKNLETMQHIARACAEKSRSQLKAINELLKTDHEIHEAESSNNYKEYLTERKSLYGKRAAECSLFDLRAEELVVAYKSKIQEINAEATISKSEPLWTLLRLENISKIEIKHLDKSTRFQGEIVFKQADLWLLLGISLSALIIGSVISVYAGHRLKAQSQNVSIKAAILKTLKIYTIPVLLVSALHLWVQFITADMIFKPPMLLISHYVMLYVFLITGLGFIFTRNNPLLNIMHIKPPLARKFFVDFFMLGGLILIYFAVNAMFSLRYFDSTLLDLIRIAYITLLTILVVRICWLFTKLNVSNKSNPILYLIRLILLFILVGVLVISCLGYYHLGLFFILGILDTVLILGALYALIYLTSWTVAFLQEPKHAISRRVHLYLGVRVNKRIVEFTILKGLLYICYILAACYGLMRVWQMSSLTIDNAKSYFFAGIKFSDFSIVPVGILLGVLAFCIVNLLGRLIAAKMTRGYTGKASHEAQVAVASLVNYLFFIVALIIGMLFSGVDFTGLAIIIGALSVGVGIGLKDIVNDIVSGIVILLEQSIKPGDRILVDNYEGTVKKIRVRSTQIVTPAKEDIIVPNSRMMVAEVVNFMFRDSLWRVTARVGVTYDSDVDYVREALLEVAHGNKEVEQDEPNQPVVMLREFEDSNMQFELWAILKDVNRKNYVASDLNFAIAEKFKEKGIMFAFPQCDLHVKEPVILKSSE